MTDGEMRLYLSVGAVVVEAVIVEEEVAGCMHSVTPCESVLYTIHFMQASIIHKFLRYQNISNTSTYECQQ